MIIGSEILSGRRRDGHLPFCIRALAARGLELAWCHVAGDEPGRLRALFERTLAGDDAVLCFGGIGATPDDHTRAAVAAAAGLPLELHPGAVAEMEARFGEQARPQRIRMAELPRGARLIPNPVNRIAGFSLARHHFVPGFPQMGWPMVEWVLDNEYREHHRAAPAEALLTLPGTSEGMVVDLLEDFERRFPAVRLSCLPHFEGDYRETELGLRGAGEAVDAGVAWLCAALEARGIGWRDGATRADRDG